MGSIPGLLQQFEESLEKTTESHPRNFEIFAAHKLGYCYRQLYLGHLGLRDTGELRGRFKAKRLIQNHLTDLIDDSQSELEVTPSFSIDLDSLIVVGEPTCYDPVEDTVYHLKTRAGWYKFHPPIKRHIDQLTVYMRGLDAQYGRLIYVSMTDFTDLRAWPPHEEPVLEYDPERFTEILARATAVREEVVKNGIAVMPHEIPFPKCGCYLCENEKLCLPKTIQTESEQQSPPEPDTPGTSDSQSALSSERTRVTPGQGSPRNSPTLNEVETGILTADSIHVPRELRDWNYWVVWDCREKIALAPWQADTMYPAQWGVDSGLNPRRDFDTAAMVSELPISEIHRSWPFPDEDNLPEQVKPAVLLPHEESDLLFIDFDNIRDPETEAVPSEVIEWINRFGGYTEISQSGTGLHTFVQAQLPENCQSYSTGLKGPGRVEMYESSRFIASTWNHVEGTPLDAVPERQSAVLEFIDQYTPITH